MTKKIQLGMLATVLAFGMTVIGCDIDGNGDPGQSGPGQPDTGQTYTGQPATSPPPAHSPEQAQRLPIETVRIQAGSFMMGSPDTEIGRNPLLVGPSQTEGPQRQVTLTNGFYMGRFPVTQGQWVEVMGSNPVNSDSVHYGRFRPVVNVMWYDALVFANRLSIREGLSPAYLIAGSTNPDDWGPGPHDISNWLLVRPDWDAVEVVSGSTGWRLPTEAQWEFAARAGTITAFSNGAQDWQKQASIANIGWFNFNSEVNGERGTRDVGTRSANPWGLHDMHGNVWEWVWDWLGSYLNAEQTDPTGPLSGGWAFIHNRVLRGGSWQTLAHSARSAVRGHAAPFMWNYNMGFRLVRP
ncbi:MAG: formylglycine-generating enzyme family protein [Spirochaetes bacterium]|nr:formylglycine-generating enzyme family protein [Spirochaetota bacterium]